METDEAAFPPVIYTYNATRCQHCHKRCIVKFDRAHLPQREKCFTSCKNLEICTHYSPVQYKAEPVIPRPLTLLQRANFTGRLPSIPEKEYVGALDKPDSPAEFFQKLQQYINWRETQRLEKENPPYQDPEFNDGIQLEAAPTVCLSCLRAAVPESVTPSFVDNKGKKPDAVLPTAPTTDPIPPPEPVPVVPGIPDEVVDKNPVEGF
jgi:hypothetical protein